MEKEFRKPVNNQIRVSRGGTINKYIYLVKVYLKMFEEVELHALGDAIQLAVRTSDTLNRKKICEIVKLDSLTVDLEKQYQNENNDDDKNEEKKIVKKPKVFIFNKS